MLLSVKKMAPGCKRAGVAATPLIPWREITAVMETVMAGAGFQHLIISVPFNEEKDDPRECENGLRPSNIPLPSNK